MIMHTYTMKHMKNICTVRKTNMYIIQTIESNTNFPSVTIKVQVVMTQVSTKIRKCAMPWKCVQHMFL